LNDALVREEREGEGEGEGGTNAMDRKAKDAEKAHPHLKEGEKGGDEGRHEPEIRGRNKVDQTGIYAHKEEVERA